MDFALAAAFGSVLDVFAAGAIAMGLILGGIIAIAWIKLER